MRHSQRARHVVDLRHGPDPTRADGAMHRRLEAPVLPAHHHHRNGSAAALSAALQAVLYGHGADRTATDTPPTATAPLPLLELEAQLDRFAPRDFESALASVYTMWNVLDHLNFQTLHHILPGVSHHHFLWNAKLRAVIMDFLREEGIEVNIAAPLEAVASHVRWLSKVGQRAAATGRQQNGGAHPGMPPAVPAESAVKRCPFSAVSTAVSRRISMPRGMEPAAVGTSLRPSPLLVT